MSLHLHTKDNPTKNRILSKYYRDIFLFTYVRRSLRLFFARLLASRTEARYTLGPISKSIAAAIKRIARRSLNREEEDMNWLISRLWARDTVCSPAVVFAVTRDFIGSMHRIAVSNFGHAANRRGNPLTCHANIIKLAEYCAVNDTFRMLFRRRILFVS